MEEIISIRADEFKKDNDISLSFFKRSSYYTNLVISYNNNNLVIFYEAYVIINLIEIQKSENELIFKINMDESIKNRKNNFQIDLTKLSIHIARGFIKDDNYSRKSFFNSIYKRMPKVGEYIFKEADSFELYLLEDEFNQWHTDSSFLKAKIVNDIMKNFFLFKDWIIDFYNNDEYYSIEKRKDIVKINLYGKNRV